MNFIIASSGQIAVPKWLWECISLNSNIIMHDIESHLEYPLTYYRISANLNLTENFISKHLSDNWN